MTKEDIEFLNRYKMQMECAVKYNYTHSIPSNDLDRMLQIYEKERGKKYNLCKHCTVSVLAFLKIMAEIYGKTNKPKSNGKTSKNEQRGKRK